MYENHTFDKSPKFMKQTRKIPQIPDSVPLVSDIQFAKTNKPLEIKPLNNARSGQRACCDESDCSRPIDRQHLTVSNCFNERTVEEPLNN